GALGEVDLQNPWSRSVKDIEFSPSFILIYKILEFKHAKVHKCHFFFFGSFVFLY
ncbi:hypothetical protein ACJX0J_020363, partial [Zea mays]